MAEDELAVAEVLNLLEAEATGAPAGGALTLASPGPDIPALREQLVVLVTTGKTKEAIGVQLMQDQVKRLPDKDVEK